MLKAAENLRLIIEQVQQLQRETTDLMNHVDTERYSIRINIMSPHCMRVIIIFSLSFYDAC